MKISRSVHRFQGTWHRSLEKFLRNFLDNKCGDIRVWYHRTYFIIKIGIMMMSYMELMKVALSCSVLHLRDMDDKIQLKCILASALIK